MKPATKIWTCPRCKECRLAPSKPRRDDSRRYCLPCSDTTGRLVERTCPALEKKRQAKEVSRRAKQKKAAARAKAINDAWPNCLAPIIKRYAKLKAWERDLTRVPFKIHRRSRPYSSGHAYRNYWHITAGTDQADAHYVVLHELAHVATPGDHHGSRFKAFLHAAIEEVVGHPVGAVRWGRGDRAYVPFLRSALGLPDNTATIADSKPAIDQ